MKNLKRFENLFDLSGHIAVVTRAAQGNGLGIANALYEAGAVVVATDISFKDEQEKKMMDGIVKMTMDVTKEVARVVLLAI